MCKEIESFVWAFPFFYITMQRSNLKKKSKIMCSRVKRENKNNQSSLSSFTHSIVKGLDKLQVFEFVIVKKKESK